MRKKIISGILLICVSLVGLYIFTHTIQKPFYLRFEFGYPEAKTVDFGQPIMIEGLEIKIEDAKQIPRYVTHIYKEPMSHIEELSSSDHHNMVLDLTVTITNTNQNEVALNDLLLTSARQINDNSFMRFFRITSSDSNAGNFINPENVLENVNPDLPTVIRANEVKKMHILYVFENSENNIFELLFEKKEVDAKNKERLSIKTVESEPTNIVQTEHLIIRPQSEFQDDKSYGMVLKIENKTNESIHLFDEACFISQTDEKYNSELLIDIKEGDGLSYLADDLINAFSTTEIVVCSDNISHGTGKFYVLGDKEYFLFDLSKE